MNIFKMETLYEIYKAHPVICTDTRKISSNSLFFCLKGENFDGNKFAEQAALSGAACVVTEKADLKDDPRFFVVDDVLTTLQQLALYHRRQLNIPFIGITGTNGKTTTKELVAAVLSEQYRVSYTQGNLNNHIGVPLTLLSIPMGTEVAIVEMGANHVGEIDDLCRLVLPTHGLITNVGVAHIEGFGSEENIFHTKTALYRSVMERQGVIFVNALDRRLLTYLADYDHVVRYGSEGTSSYGAITTMSPYLQLQVGNNTIQTHLTGEYNLMNILSALAVGLHLGVPMEKACHAIAHYVPQNHRSQVIQSGSNTLIADYYNANPTSMRAALVNLSHIHHDQKIAILGDMLELGHVSRTEHQQIVELCKELNIKAYYIGQAFSDLAKQYPDDLFFQDSESVSTYLKHNPLHDAMILIKGSRGIHLEKIEI